MAQGFDVIDMETVTGWMAWGFDIVHTETCYGLDGLGI